MLMARHVLIAALGLVAASRGAAQTPTVRIEFRLRDLEYRQAFADSERPYVEDSARAVLVEAFRRHYGFVSFTRDTADPTPRVLLITLDQRDGGPSDDLGEVGLRVVLRNPPHDSLGTYWITLREAGADLAGEALVGTFVPVFRDKIDRVPDAKWSTLFGELLNKISIADSSGVEVYGTPPSSFLIPYLRKDLCIDAATSTLSVLNRSFLHEGTDDRVVIASTSALFNPPGPLPRRFARYKGHIWAMPINPPALPVADSQRVQNVYMHEYHRDRVACTEARALTGESNP